MTEEEELLLNLKDLRIYLDDSYQPVPKRILKHRAGTVLKCVADAFGFSHVTVGHLYVSRRDVMVDAYGFGTVTVCNDSKEVGGYHLSQFKVITEA